MDTEPNTNYVPVASKGNSNRVRFKFLSLSPKEVQQFLSSTAGGSSRDLLVWMLIINAARVSREKTIQFSARWRFGVDIDRKTIYRCLKRLELSGLISVDFRRGKSPLITLIN